jgi:hypothetical protein
MSRKPPIILNTTSQPFWDGVGRHELMLQFDAVRDRYQFFPRPLSLHSTQPLEWRKAAGTGTLVAITLTHFPAPGFKEKLPYLEGLIRLDEGPRIFAPVTGARLEQLQPGRRMRIVWPQQGDTGAHPFQFEPLNEHPKE